MFNPLIEAFYEFRPYSALFVAVYLNCIFHRVIGFLHVLVKFLYHPGDLMISCKRNDERFLH